MVALLPRARVALAAGPTFVVACALYVPTLLPDVGTWDTAEFQAIGPVLGVAHPTGYPTYTLLAWLASVVLQPFGNEAYRADLLSALLVAGAAALAAIATLQLTRRWVLGVVAGLLLATTPVAWRVATRADAHALHVFMAALIFVLLIGWAKRHRPNPEAGDPATPGDPAARSPGSGRWLVAASLVFGLSLGNHALTLLLAPGIAVFVLLTDPRILWRRKRLVAACLATVAATMVVVYAYLPIRSAMQPPLDYASPDTWQAFWYVVLGEQFQGSFRALPTATDMIAGVWDQLVRNLGLLVVLVPAGVVLGLTRYPRVVALTALWFVSTWLFALGYANAVIERYYLVPIMVACVWVALAADIVWDVLRDAAGLVSQRATRLHGRTIGTALVLVLLVATLASVPGRYDVLDSSENTFGRRWLEATLAALDPNAVIVSWWSYSTPLWYGRWVEGRRPDITIVDDRNILDDGYGTAAGAIDRFLGQRPVYVIRLARDLPAIEARYVLERVASIPGPGDTYRVVGLRASAPNLSSLRWAP